MPAMELDHQDLGAFAYLYAEGFMRFPSDTARREIFQAYAIANIELGICREDKVSLDRRILERLVDAAKFNIFDDTKIAAGLIAGDVLTTVLALAAAEVPDAGLDKAQYVVSRLYSENFRSVQGDRYRAGRESVANHWAAFRSVSHFWAAFHVLFRQYEEKAPDGRSSEEARKYIAERGDELLIIANGIFTKASQYILPRSKLLLLDPEWAWYMNRVPLPHTLEPPQLTDAEKLLLSEFKGRHR